MRKRGLLFPLALQKQPVTLVVSTPRGIMSVGIKVGSIADEIGTPDFLHAFFSTVSFNLESDGWGSRFPTLLNKLYQGELKAELAAAALAELSEIKDALSKLEPSKVVWDIEDLTIQPPWGKNISQEITSLANGPPHEKWTPSSDRLSSKGRSVLVLPTNYFVTSTGRDLITTLAEAFKDAENNNKDITIIKC